VGGNPRRYSAPGREAQARSTRARIIAAAHDAFARGGFTATIREVAEAAQVSAATVELLFGTKAALLDAVVDVALAGDDEPVPVLEREWVHALDEVSAADFLNAVAAAFAAGAGRVAPVLAALDEGSARQPALAELANRLRRQRMTMARWVVAGLTSRSALVSDLTPDDAVETVLVLIDPLLQRRLLVERDFTVDRLAAWLGRSLRRLLLQQPEP
jgi:AcrR family transcriptional regulator